MKCWVDEKLTRAPSTCTNENAAPEKILDSLEVLVSEQKRKNEHMNLYICQSVLNQKSDTVQVKDNDSNENIGKWCRCGNNNINITETVSVFKTP